MIRAELLVVLLSAFMLAAEVAAQYPGGTRIYADKVQKLADDSAKGRLDSRVAAATPADAVQQLEHIAGGARDRATSIDGIVQAGIVDPAFAERMNDLGGQVVSQDKATPEGLRVHLKSEIDRWTPIIRKAGVYAE